MVGDTLYYLVGGYMRDGSVFYYDLPVSEMKRLELNIHNPSIEKTEGNYFIVGGEGDAGWVMSQYYLLDPSTKTTKKIVAISSNCGLGDWVVNVGKDKVIMARAESSVTLQACSATADYVYYIDFVSPEVKHILIPKAMMPKDISDINYDKERNQLHLSGNNGSYLFDLNTNAFVSKIDFSDKIAPLLAKDKSNKYFNSEKSRVSFFDEQRKVMVLTDEEVYIYNFESPDNPTIIKFLPDVKKRWDNVAILDNRVGQIRYLVEKNQIFMLGDNVKIFDASNGKLLEEIAFSSEMNLNPNIELNLYYLGKDAFCIRRASEDHFANATKMFVVDLLTKKFTEETGEKSCSIYYNEADSNYDKVYKDKAKELIGGLEEFPEYEVVLK